MGNRINYLNETYRTLSEVKAGIQINKSFQKVYCLQMNLQISFLVLHQTLIYIFFVLPPFPREIATEISTGRFRQQFVSGAL